MHRITLTCATVLATTAIVTACSSSPAKPDDADAHLRDPSRGVNPDEGARTLVDQHGSGGFATRVTIPRSAESVRVSVSCAPSGTFTADLGDAGSAGGECHPRAGSVAQLSNEVTGRHDLMLTTNPGGRWWLKVESIDHTQSS